MATETTSKILFDGLIKTVMQFTGYSVDGVGETNAVKVDASTLQPVPTKLKVLDVSYDVNGGAIKLTWDGVAAEDFLILTGQGSFNYIDVGGLQNDAEGATQDITLTTLNWEPGSSYSLTLEMRKL